MTLLERWDMSQDGHPYITDDEIRRALAIAQAVDDWVHDAGLGPENHAVRQIMRCADKLLEGK